MTPDAIRARHRLRKARNAREAIAAERPPPDRASTQTKAKPPSKASALWVREMRSDQSLAYAWSAQVRKANCIDAIDSAD